VNYLRRWAPLAGDLREAANGAIGDVQAVTARYTKGLLNNGTHHLDLLAMAFGPPVAVRALGTFDDGRTEDRTVEAELTFTQEGRSFAARLLGADYRAFQVFELEVLGTAGRLRMLDGGRTVERQAVVADADFAGYRLLGPTTSSDGGLGVAMEAALSQLLDVLSGVDSEPRCTVTDGVAAVATAEAITASLLGAEDQLLDG